MRYSELYMHANFISNIIIERARSIAIQNGLSSNYPFLHARKAYLALCHGHTWTGVSVEAIKEILRLEKLSYIV